MSAIDHLKKAAGLAPWVIVVAMAVCNGLLIRQNLQLRADLEKQKPKILQSGDRLRGFIATGIQGQGVSISYPGQGPRRVFLYFSPDCPYCHDQFPLWRELIERADRSKFEIIGVVSQAEDKARVLDYERSFGCESLNVVFAPNDVLRDYKLAVTPTTIVAGNDGKVEKAWAGSWDENGLNAASSAFGFPFQKE